LSSLLPDDKTSPALILFAADRPIKPPATTIKPTPSNSSITMFSSIKYNGIRWQQAPYFSAVVYSTCAIISSSMMSRFNDINFPGVYATEYHSLTSVVDLHVETNVALLAVASLLWIADLFRKTPFPVALEMSWALVFGLLQVGNIIKAGMTYPEAHCTLSPAIEVLTNGTVALARRDSATADVIGTIQEFTPAAQQTIIIDAAKQVCATWTAEFTFFTICAIALLFSHCLWFAFVAIRHRRSHPDYIMDPVPAPFTWDLPTETAVSGPVDIETASVTSTAVSSTFDEKKDISDDAPVMVQLPAPTRQS